jgi:hypothetical protein
MTRLPISYALRYSRMAKTREMSDSSMEWLNSMISLSRLARMRELKELAAKSPLIIFSSYS